MPDGDCVVALRAPRNDSHRHGVFIFDKPESALSPSRQIMFLRLLRRMEARRQCQVIMATHSPLLMAYPGAQLLLLTKYGSTRSASKRPSISG